MKTYYVSQTEFIGPAKWALKSRDGEGAEELISEHSTFEEAEAAMNFLVERTPLPPVV